MELGNSLTFSRLIILADASANWKIGGLRQLDRLVLAANEFAAERKVQLETIIFWHPTIPASQRWLPESKRITSSTARFAENETVAAQGDVAISTQLLVTRRGLREFLGQINTVQIGSSETQAVSWQQLDEFWKQRCLRIPQSNEWRVLSSENQAQQSTVWLLKTTGKSYDGLVSTYLNRPLSRLVSRMVLFSPITPNQWTLLILALPILAAVCLSRGNYLGFVVGAALFHLHSVLDGCDGEIARIKYLDSKSGPGIDALGDLIALLVFVAGLTTGLFKSADANLRWIFLVEGGVAFLLIAGRLGPHTRELLLRGMDAVRSSEHGRHVRKSGDHYLGPALTSIALAITGRDVVFLFFLIMALFGMAPWILHLLFIYSLGAVLLVLKGRSMRSAHQVRPALP